MSRDADLRRAAVLSLLPAALCACRADHVRRDSTASAQPSTATAPSDASPDERAIRAATQRWNAAQGSTDTTELFSVFADQGVWLRPNLPAPILNKDSLRKFARILNTPSSDQTQETLRVVVASSGDLAYELGRFSRGGQRQGYYVRVWQKQGTEWKLLATVPQAYEPVKAR
jgi:ketosteroid isomerase-like protein